jgi:PD-(D/E)XK nuclease superfamily protein
VQCKWGALAGDVIVVRCYSCRRTRNGLLQRDYDGTEIDAVAAYCLGIDRAFYFPVEWLNGRRVVQLRVSPSRNKQHRLINRAEDFEFAARLSGFVGP